VGVAHAGTGGREADPEHRVNAIVVDFITPENENSMWYFWGFARAFKPEDKSLTDQIRQGQGKIFAEDLEMLEQQQQNLQLNFADKKLLKLDIDAGGVQARRLIERLIKQERATAGSAINQAQAGG
jgi:vanillate monooxygenase